MKNIKEVLNTLGQKKFWSLTLGLSLPVLMLATLLIFAPITSFATLFLIPLVVPLLAVNMQKIWYAAMKRDDSSISSVGYSSYYKTPGLYGGLGILAPTLWGLLVGFLALLILSTTCIKPLMDAFGNGEIYTEFMNLLSKGVSNEALDYLTNNSNAFLGPIIILYGIAIFIGLVAFILFFFNSTQAYVFFQRALPDADINLVGGQARTLGKILLRGTFFKRLKENWLIVTLIIGIGTIINGGFIALLVLVPSSYSSLFISIPAAISLVLLTPLFTLLIASNVLTADKVMPAVVKQCDPRILAELAHFYRDPRYHHSEENKNKQPFGGNFDSAITVDVTETVDTSDFFVPSEDDVTPKKEENEDSPAFGFFDFGEETKEEELKDSTNVEEKSDEDKKDE